MLKWDRTRPIISLIKIGAVFVVFVELALLLSGRWLLTETWAGRDFIPVPEGVTTLGGFDFGDGWPILQCTYWTGRSFQTVEYGDSRTAPPPECPLLTSSPDNGISSRII